MGWIIKLKIYVVLIVVVNFRYIKIWEIKKKKSLMVLIDFVLLNFLLGSIEFVG